MNFSSASVQLKFIHKRNPCSKTNVLTDCSERNTLRQSRTHPQHNGHNPKRMTQKLCPESQSIFDGKKIPLPFILFMQLFRTKIVYGFWTVYR